MIERPAQIALPRLFGASASDMLRGALLSADPLRVSAEVVPSPGRPLHEAIRAEEQFSQSTLSLWSELERNAEPIVCRGSSEVEGRGVYAQQHAQQHQPNKPPDATAPATPSSPSSTVSQPLRVLALALLT
jgi:hypothetical protein